MRGIFLDLETTGLDWSTHVVIDIAFKVVDLSENKLEATFQSLIKQPREEWERHDPASIRVNGYTWEDLQQGADRDAVENEVIQLLSSLKITRGKAVFICQNPGFDRSFFRQIVDVYTQESLQWPYHWLDLASMYWAAICMEKARYGEKIPELLNLSKDEIARTYNLPPEATPHRAINGVNHLIACYQAVMGSFAATPQEERV